MLMTPSRTKLGSLTSLVFQKMGFAVDGEVSAGHIDGTCDTAVAFVRSASIISSGLASTNELVLVRTGNSVRCPQWLGFVWQPPARMRGFKTPDPSRPTVYPGIPRSLVFNFDRTNNLQLQVLHSRVVKATLGPKNTIAGRAYTRFEVASS